MGRKKRQQSFSPKAVKMSDICWMDQMPDEVLEKILCYLDFSSLIACEMTCKRWHKLINQRRLFWQLAKNIAKSEVIKKKKKPEISRPDLLASAARAVRKQANKFRRKRLIQHICLCSLA